MVGVYKGATYMFQLHSHISLGEEAAKILSISEDTPRGHMQILEAPSTVLLHWLPPVPAEHNTVIVKHTVAVREARAPGSPRNRAALGGLGRECAHPAGPRASHGP